MNWGHKIIITFIIFAGIIISMVIISMRQPINLVATNYYEEELAYQAQIDRIKNYKLLIEKPIMTKEGSRITLTFPPDLARDIIEGEILFFRPSDHTQDIKQTLSLDASSTQSFAIHNFTKGLWKVKLKWNTINKSYFKETSIII